MICPRDQHAYRRVLAALAIGYCIVLLAGCDSNSSTESDNSIAGRWAATLSTDGVTQEFDLSLSETDNPVGGKSISGAGSVASTARSVTFEVAGSYVHPILSLEATFDVPPGTNPIGNISGQVNAARTEIVATLSGPGISGQTVFTRDD